jgi:hypothetical protein
VDLQTQRAIPKSISKACQLIWPVNRQGWKIRVLWSWQQRYARNPRPRGTHMELEDRRRSHWSDAAHRIDENS